MAHELGHSLGFGHISSGKLRSFLLSFFFTLVYYVNTTVYSIVSYISGHPALFWRLWGRISWIHSINSSDNEAVALVRFMQFCVLWTKKNADSYPVWLLWGALYSFSTGCSCGKPNRYKCLMNADVRYATLCWQDDLAPSKRMGTG